MTAEEGKAFADFYNIKFIETSAKNNDNVDLAFKTIAEDVYDKILSGEFVVEDGWEGIREGRSLISASSGSSNLNGSSGYYPIPGKHLDHPSGLNHNNRNNGTSRSDRNRRNRRSSGSAGGSSCC